MNSVPRTALVPLGTVPNGALPNGTMPRSSSKGRGASAKKEKGRQADERKPYKFDALILALIMFICCAVWRVQDLYPIIGTVKLPILIELIVLYLFLSDASPMRQVRWIRSPIVTLVGALLIVILAGLPTSLWLGKGITFITRDLLPTLGLFIIVAASVREFEDLDRLAFGMLTGCMLYSGYAYISHAQLVNSRIGSLEFYDANDFGLLLSCTMPFAIYFLRPGVIWWKRLYALGGLGLFVIMMIRSGSRGGFLAFIAVMLHILFRFRAIPGKMRITAVAAGVGMLLLMGSSNYWQMMGTIFHPKDDYNMTSDVGRKKVWKRGIGYMLTHPLVGVGVRAFPQAEGLLSAVAKQNAEVGRGIKWSVAHNSFVEIGAECGIPGLLIFLSLFGVSIRDMLRIKTNKRRPGLVTVDDEAYAQMLITSLVGFMVAGFFVSAEYFAFLYVVFGLVVGMTAVQRKRAFTARRLRRKMMAAQAAAGVTGVATPGGPAGPARPMPRPPVQWLPAGP